MAAYEPHRPCMNSKGSNKKREPSRNFSIATKNTHKDSANNVRPSVTPQTIALDRCAAPRDAHSYCTWANAGREIKKQPPGSATRPRWVTRMHWALSNTDGLFSCDCFAPVGLWNAGKAAQAISEKAVH